MKTIPLSSYLKVQKQNIDKPSDFPILSKKKVLLKSSTLAGLEPAISGVGNRRLIH